MARLEIKLVGKNIGADKALLTARTVLKMLRSIEKEMTGKRAITLWRVDIFSGFEETIVVIRTEKSPDKDSAAALDGAEAMLAKLQKP